AGAKWLHMFWALDSGGLTMAMRVAGGVTTMGDATLSFAPPVTTVAYLLTASFPPAGRRARAEREGRTRKRRTAAAHGGRAPEKTWRQRLATLRSYPSQKSVSRFVAEVIEPSLTAVAEEFRALGYSVDLTQEFDESTGIN